MVKKYHGYKEITQSIENGGKIFEVLEGIVNKYKDYLKVEGDNAEYPAMKCLDMFLWQVGFELDLSNSFEGAKDENKAY